MAFPYVLPVITVADDDPQTIMNNGGPKHWAGTVSDNTGNVRVGRRESVVAIPSLMNLADCVHAIHNTIKEMSGIEYFEGVS
jgi:hypothetical protein